MNVATAWTSVAVDAIGWMLIHSLWQVTAVYLLFLGSITLAGKDALRRHRIGVAALFLIVTAGMVTGLAEVRSAQSRSFAASPKAESPLPGLQRLVKSPRADEKMVPDQLGRIRFERVDPSLHDRFAVAVEPALPLAVFAWFGGFAVLSVIHAMGLWAIRRATWHAALPSSSDMDRWVQIARSIGVHRLVRYGISNRIQVPMTVGWLKPAIYVPIQLAMHFSTEEIDAMIAHELAHIRRYDYLVNQIQVVLESLLYFHPCMWMLSNRIRRDRELCCDAVAVASCGNSSLFQKALVRLADLRWTSQWRLAPAIAGGSLVERVAVLARPNVQIQRSPVSLALIMVLGGACLAAASRDVYQRAEDQRDLKFMATTHESVLIAKTFNIGPADESFRNALIDGVAAVRQKASIDDERVIRLVESCRHGVDFDLVWREYQKFIRDGKYPIGSREFPPNWGFGMSGVQRQLARLIWSRARSLPPGREQEDTAKAALAIASMKRETSGTTALQAIILSAQFESVSSLSHDSALRLKRYMSVSSDAIGDSIGAVRELYDALNHPRTADVRKILGDSFVCGDRLPEISYCVACITNSAPESTDKQEVLKWLRTARPDDDVVQRNLVLGTTSSGRSVLSLIVGE